MDADLKEAYDRVMQANRPEDAFKPLTVMLPPRLLEEHLAPEVEEMRVVLDESKYSSFDDKESVRIARARLDAFCTAAFAKAAKGLYAVDDYQMLVPPSGKNINVDGITYSVGEKFHVGEHSALYKGRIVLDKGSAGVIIRVANTPEDNPHLFNEIRILEMLHRKDVGYWKNMPFLLARFNSGERVGVVYRYFEGLTLTEVRANKLHRNGLDQRHVVWVMDRMLGLLWYVHTMGIIHGRIEPQRIRVRPSNHNALLTGWGQAVYRPAVTDERIASVGGVFEAPEVRDSGEVGPWTDIYCLGKSLIWLIGGDPVTNEMPESVEVKIRQFLFNMVRKSPRARPQDAKQLYQAQNRLKDSLWERRFIHLDIA